MIKFKGQWPAPFIILTAIILTLNLFVWVSEHQKTNNNPVIKSNSSENTNVNCDTAQTQSGDELAMLLDQPQNNQNLCLFVGCNSFF